MSDYTAADDLDYRFCGFCDDYATGHLTDRHGDRYGYCDRHRAQVRSLIIDEDD
jgi:hypothetical protein